MQQHILTAGTLLLAALLSGCFGAAPIKPVSSPQASAAYGNITLPDNKVITRVIMYKVGESYAPPIQVTAPEPHLQ